MKKRITLLFCGLGIALLAGCSSGPPIIPDDLSVLQFFQRAQEEFDYDEWENALIYYNTFIERHPDDIPHVISARYEIAFIYYKQKNYDEAEKEFQEILDFYEETDLPLSFPLWPRVLSQKMLQIMKDKNLLTEDTFSGEV